MADPLPYPKTFGGVRTLVLQLARWATGNEVSLDPWFIDRCIYDRTDMVAVATASYKRTVRVDIVNGTNLYTMGSIYEPLDDECQSVTGTGLFLPLSVRTEKWMAEWDAKKRRPISLQWRNVLPSDPPRILIPYGGNSFRLFPTPSIDRAEGVYVRGKAIPEENWDVVDDLLSGTTEDSAFPLATGLFTLVGYSAALDVIKVTDSKPDPGRADHIMQRITEMSAIGVNK